MWRQGRITALEVGIGMIPRGEVGLIIAAIGLQMNMMSQAAYAVVLFMASATTLIAPPMVRLVFRGERRQAERGVPAITTAI
jgi:Kef-type K+ transport system membrane component KefB